MKLAPAQMQPTVFTISIAFAAGACAVFAYAAIASAADNAQEGEYYVKDAWPIGGDGGFDFVTLDQDGKYLYVPRSSHTEVVEIATGKVVADIPDNSRSHGVVLVPEHGRGFISNGGDATVQVFDLKSNQSLGKIKAADDADVIIYDPQTKNVLAFCGDAHQMISISADVDPKSGIPNATIDLGGKPEFAVSDGKGKVYVNLVDKDEVAVVDIVEMRVIKNWPVAPGAKPVSMAMDQDGKRLFVGCRNKTLIVMSTEDGQVLAELPIGAGVDATVFNSGTAFSSCGDGTLALVRETSPGNFAVVETVKTAPRAKTMAMDEKTGSIYLPTAEGQGRTQTTGTFKILVVARR